MARPAGVLESLLPLPQPKEEPLLLLRWSLRLSMAQLRQRRLVGLAMVVVLVLPLRLVTAAMERGQGRQTLQSCAASRRASARIRCGTV